jgi:DNA-binding transcriptional LysR family regulator
MTGRAPAKTHGDGWTAPEISALRSALMVREHLGFRRASEVLGVNPSVLSRRVLALEDALGVSLFQRGAGGARPTGAGERFLVEVDRALELLQRAVARAGAAGRGEEGRLRLGHVWPLSVGPGEHLLRTYRRAWAEVELELRDGSASVLAAAVLDRELDVALMAADDAPPDLERLLLWSEPWLLAKPTDGETPGLGEAPVLCAASDDCARIRRLAAAAGGVRAGVRAQMTSHDGVLSLVAAGAGLAIVPQSVAQSTRADVSFSLLPGAPPALRLCAAWRRDHDNPALRRFLSQLRAADMCAATSLHAAE